MIWFKKKNSNINDVAKQINRDVEATVRTVLHTMLANTDNVATLAANVAVLSDEKRKLKDEVITLRKEKELEKLETEHLVALKEERMILKVQQREIELEKKYQERELALRKEAYEQMVENINSASADIKEVYTQIMKRLPDVNMEIKKRTK